ncbi:hypothetical protein [Williamsia serinedens]|uniref:Transmembrane protein n=1 Tax=Williamsia serinedens TaxID=391736 RepID=A0ABT1H5J8_9NOCA|nr:hypothetical protein [Williamsia serinedens]MCP2162514.1 hypothetical protein [Williamsia serinedens]
MLVSALGATLVGFALLVLALATGTLWLAVACIVICVVGALLLLADTLGVRPHLPRRRPTATSSQAQESEADRSDDDAPTEQFARITDETVVTLDDDPATGQTSSVEHDPAAPAHHGRHERPDLDDAGTPVDDAADESAADPPRRGRHGTPD